MAATFVQTGGLSVTFMWVDKSKNRASNGVYLPASTTLAQAKAFAEALAAKLELASDAQIQGYTITASAMAQGAAAPVAGGNVEQKGMMSFMTAAAKNTLFSIPAPKVVALTADERALKEGDALIDDIVSLMLTGSGGAVPCDSNGSDITALIETWVKHRSSRVG